MRSHFNVLNLYPLAFCMGKAMTEQLQEKLELPPADQIGFVVPDMDAALEEFAGQPKADTARASCDDYALHDSSYHRYFRTD